MPERVRVRAAEPPVASASVFVATFAGVIALIVAMLAFDTSLARVDRRENAAHAAHLYEDGMALLAAGNAADARDRLSSAVALERGSVTYALGFAQALVASGRDDDAGRVLGELLDRSDNSGAVNLVMARFLAHKGRDTDAIVHFHRAIDGRWGADSTRWRNTARFELLDLLARRRDDAALLAELLPLEAAFPDSAPIRRRVAHLFIRAGSPRRGVTIFREFLRADLRDADAYAGMGEAALALGNFATARADLAEAVRLSPGDPRLAGRLALADSVISLDPRLRGLSAAERARRSRAMLQRTLAALARCAGRSPSGVLADSARAAVEGPAAPGVPPASDAARLARITMSLWTARDARCSEEAVPDEALVVLLRSMEQ